MSDERVKCWGESLEGALGYNDTAVVGDSDNQMGVHLPPVELGKDAAGNPFSTHGRCSSLRQPGAGLGPGEPEAA